MNITDIRVKYIVINAIYFGGNRKKAMRVWGRVHDDTGLGAAISTK